MNSSANITRQVVYGVASHPRIAQPDGSLALFDFFTDLPAGSRVLDVGCGGGVHLKVLAAKGYDVVGLEPDARQVAELRAAGYEVRQGVAEQLPFGKESFDCIVCSVVLPYVNEQRAIAEWRRVLSPAGEVRASYHGWGYAFWKFQESPSFRRGLYSTRMLINSVCCQFTNCRLPGALGDANCQTQSRLARYYRRHEMRLSAEYINAGPFGSPRYIYHRLVRS